MSVWGPLVHFRLSTPHISKTAAHRAKRGEIWDSGTLVTPIWCTFDLVVFNVDVIRALLKILLNFTYT